MAQKHLAVRNLLRVLLAATGAPLVGLSWFFPRSKTRWLFGSQRGYHDNSRYLMEYVVANHPEIDAAWLALDDEAQHAAEQSGVRAVRAGTWAATLETLRAGVGVISNGLGDLSRGLTGGMFITQLYHATPLKKINLDFPGDCQVIDSPSLLGRFINSFVLMASKSAWRRNNLIIATSNNSAQRMASAFGVSPERVAITGSPRADILLSQEEAILAKDARFRETLLTNSESLHNNAKAPQVVLYAPTWREDGDEACLWESFDAEQINRRLQDINAVLAIRLHPFSQLAIYEELKAKKLTNIIPVQGRVDFQTLLRCSDILITDYSSGCADFSVLKRPVIFFTPDFEKYQGSRDFYEPLEELTLGKQCTRWSEVVDQIAQSIDGNKAAMEVSENLRTRFNQFDDTSNRQRIVAEIMQRVGLN